MQEGVNTLRHLEDFAKRRAESIYADDIQTLLGQMTLAPFEAEKLRYTKIDVEELFFDVVIPRLELVEELWKTIPVYLKEGRIGGRLRRNLSLANERMMKEYLQLRHYLIKTMASLVHLTEVQRLGLLFLFQAAIGLNALHYRLVADAENELSACNLGAADFDYVRVFGEKAGFPLNAASSELPLGKYDLNQWNTAMNLLLKALHMAGPGGGPNALPSVLPYWRGLWERYAMFLFDSDEEKKAEQTNTHISPDFLRRPDVARLMGTLGFQTPVLLSAAKSTVPGLFNVQFATEDASGESLDVKNRRLTNPLPYVRGGRRLRLVFVLTCESIFHTHHLRFTALANFEQAVTQGGRRGQAIAARFTQEFLANNAAATAISAFFEHVHHHSNPTLVRYVSEDIYQSTSNAQLMAGEVERFILTAHDLASKPTGATTVETKPHADEVISTLRLDDYSAVVRYANLAYLFERVSEEYMKHALGEKEMFVAYNSERVGIATLSIMIDAMMALAGTPEHNLFRNNTYIDELVHGFRHMASHSAQLAQKILEAAMKRQALPLTPAAALEALGGAELGCTLVRLMRRTFLVIAKPSVTIELPTFAIGLVSWLVTARLPPELLPEGLRDLALRIRNAQATR